MRTIRTHADVDAPPAAVWRVLADLASYPQWNPHVTRATGDLSVGSTLDVRVRREGVVDRSMAVTVTDVDPPRRLEWVSTVAVPWLFRGRHTFELEPLSGDRTRLHNREGLSGLFVPIVVTDRPERDDQAMDRALAERAERLAGG